MHFLEHIDQQLFIFLNGLHNPFIDRVMFHGTKALLWLPLYLLFLYLVILKYKWNTLLILVVATLLILVSDQLSNLVKDSVQRLRPSQQPGLAVHLVDAYKGGRYGFYSAHASNTAAVAVFLILLIGRKSGFVWFLAISWSLILSYTRIYLGLHYPGDLLMGWLTGGILGFLFGMATLKVIAKIHANQSG